MSAAVRLGLCLLLAAAIVAPVAAAPPHGPAVPRPRDADAAHRYFTDVVLVDHEGQSRRLYTDLLRDKVVVVNSFFTTCIDSCPIVMGKLLRIQEALSDHLGRHASILSITVDPATDTPARMKDYVARLGARPGWYLLGGDPSNVQVALRKLGHATRVKDAHTNLLIVGNERTGLWKKAHAMAGPDDLVRLVQGVLEDR